MLLAGDLGGTKINLAIYAAERGPREPLLARAYPSRAYDSLNAIIATFLEEVDLPVTRLCVGVAGPVVGGTATVTNLSWRIEAAELKRNFHFKAVRLLNDLEAIANAVPILENADLVCLNPGTAQVGGAIAVVAPGTGLGEAYLTWQGGHYQANPTEGGHTDFSPTNDLELELLGYLKRQFGHVSVERVCSGKGIPNIYAGLKALGVAQEPDWLAKRLAQAEDPTPVIVRAAQEGPERCDLCALTLRTFISILGAEAGNLALKIFATGGVYLGGGIPPKILPQLTNGDFMRAFVNKGRMGSLLANFPVHVILNERAALLGAARFGLTQL